MKSRNVILAAILSALVGFALLPKTQAAPETALPGLNTADGDHALFSLTTGSANTAVGWFSLGSDTEGSNNTAVGAAALVLNQTGTNNTAVGIAALLSNISAVQNTAVGQSALLHTTGGANTAVGAGTLSGNIGGNFNTAVGKDALANTNNTGNNSNTALGHQAGAFLTSGGGNVYIGQGVTGVASEAGHTYIRNINNTNVSGGGTDTVTVDLTTGLLGHLTSSRRYKEDIKPMDKASEALYRLKPVTYRYKKEIDRTQSPAFGLIAEQVAEVNADLVARNAEGKPESVHYEMVNAMLLNEFLKEHRTVQELKKEIAALTATVKEQAAQIQKVSTQIEVSKPAAKVVLNNP